MQARGAVGRRAEPVLQGNREDLLLGAVHGRGRRSFGRRARDRRQVRLPGLIATLPAWQSGQDSGG